MGKPKEEVPFLGKLLVFFLYPLLAYITYFAFKLRSYILRKRKKDWKIQENQPETQVPSQFEPHPPNNQKREFLSINEDENVYITCILTTYNCAQMISQFLLDFLSYFHNFKEQNPKNTYQVLIIDNHSKDQTPNLIRDIAYHHSEVRFLHLTQHRSQVMLIASAFKKCRGRLVYFYDLSDSLLLSQFQNFHQTYNKYISLNKKIMIIGAYSKQQYHLNQNSNLKIFLSYFIDLFWNFYGLDKKAKHHCRSFLISYEALCDIIPQISYDSNSCTDQILAIALKSNSINIHSFIFDDGSVNCKISSEEMLQSVFVQIKFFGKFFLANMKDTDFKSSFQPNLLSLPSNIKNGKTE